MLACPHLPQEGKLAASEELGDLFKAASDWDTAQAIYQQAGCSGKVVEVLAAKGDFDQLVRRPGCSGGEGQGAAAAATAGAAIVSSGSWAAHRHS